MTDIAKFVDWCLSIANKGGALTASALLFLWAFSASAILFKFLEWQYTETLKRLEAWIGASKAEEQQTAAMNKMAEGLRMICEAQSVTATQVSILVALIKDRRDGV